MGWTHEQLVQIPEVYRDFMRTLWPITESRDPDAILKTTAMPVGRIYTQLREIYDYSQQQMRKITDNLKEGGWINEDSMGFITPTTKGEQLLKQIKDWHEPMMEQVPPLPKL